MMNKYYIQLFSPHGLIRFNNAEIGKDKDTGGQVKYLIELLDHLSKHPQVRKVDLFTRRIVDKRVSATYEKEEEIVNEKARIIRISCGGNTYRHKESLWDFLDEFVDKTIRFIEKEGDFPDIVHGHYADGNYLARQIAEAYGIPFIATSHSLGRNKRQILMQQGWTSDKIDEKFNMARRIAEEELLLQCADAIIASTQHVIEAQYSLYDNYKKGKFEVIPPGQNNELFYPFYRYEMPSFKMSIEQEQTVYRLNSEIDRFLFNSAKPLILSIGRADKRKNFETIIQAYGQDKELQAMANLAIFAGIRKDISQMADDEKEILTNLLLLLDKYDLYGKMAIPKKNDPRLEVPEIYRLAARKKGVFVNATPGENFGLTIVEAAACGLPVVASPTGGPKEIIEKCENGLLVDVEDPAAIAAAVKKMITDRLLWESCSTNGVKGADQFYSWPSHVSKYLSLIDKLFMQKEQDYPAIVNKTAYGRRFAEAKKIIISDIDGTLVDGNNVDGLDELKEWITAHREDVIFGVASGRNLQIAKQAFETYDLPDPDILICSAGSEIYYTNQFIPDKGWESHIDRQWKRDELQNELSKFPGLRLQEPGAQWPYKLSYYVNEDFDADAMANLNKFLDDRKLMANILLTENKFLDLLPIRAGKGNAVRYLSYKWRIPLEQFITVGNSGNDKDMLTGKTKAIVVANYSPEMEELKDNKDIYFTKHPLSLGVLEGIHFYISSKPFLTGFDDQK